MKVKLNNKGVALVEYAVLLSFISAIALSFGSSNGLMGSISGAVNKATSAINMILGVNVFSEAALKDALVGMKDSTYKTYQFSTHPDYVALGSDLNVGDAFLAKCEIESRKFEEKVLSKINFGEVPVESWRFLNENQGDIKSQYAYLIWSDTDWGSGNYKDQLDSKTACMYARIDKTTNSVQYGVAYANPMGIHPGDGTINGWHTSGGGMVNISQGVTSNLKFDNNWIQKDSYNAADSPYFTSDYNTAVNLYKELQAKSQSK